MTALPIAHRGQIFDLDPVDAYSSGRFRVVLRREVDTYDADGWIGTEHVEESLGTVEVVGRSGWADDGYVEARTRYNRRGDAFHDLAAAVAFLVAEGRPCGHPDGDGIGGDRFECGDCGATFALDEEHEISAVEFAHAHA